MTLSTINKLDIALSQLDTALDLYFNGGDKISVLTLAGAAEEILGRYVENKGSKSALAHQVHWICEFHKKQFGIYPPSEKPIYHRANYARNSFKHMNGGNDIEVTVDIDEEVCDMLNRAVDNYWILTEHQTPLMERYEKERSSV